MFFTLHKIDASQNIAHKKVCPGSSNVQSHNSSRTMHIRALFQLIFVPSYKVRLKLFEDLTCAKQKSYHNSHIA